MFLFFVIVCTCTYVYIEGLMEDKLLHNMYNMYILYERGSGKRWLRAFKYILCY